MKRNLQLFVLFLILLASQTVGAAINRSPWTIAAELAKEMASMGYTMTSKNSSGALSFRQSKGAVVGKFVLGRKGMVTVPTWVAQDRKWVQTSTREVLVFLVRVRIRLYTEPAKKTPKSLKRYAKKPRKRLLVITRRGNPAPSLEQERIPYTETVAYTQSRHAGAKIERIITSTGPRKRITAAGGVTFTACPMTKHALAGLSNAFSLPRLS